MTSLSPAVFALMTTSRSAMTATSATSGFATETFVTAFAVVIGNERPIGRST
jgi:hypothetical protein